MCLKQKEIEDNSQVHVSICIYSFPLNYEELQYLRSSNLIKWIVLIEF